MATIFITGGAGFIGSNFIRYWLENYPDDQVINYDLLTYAGNLDNLKDVEERFSARYLFIQGNIGNAHLTRHLFEKHQPEWVINFAAESHNSRAVVHPDLFFQTNVLGTQRLLHSAWEAKVPRFHHISTCEVYGDLPLDSEERFSETSPYRPNTPYNASKAAADMAVRAYHETFGLPTTISNCSNNYGQCQFPEKLIPSFTIKLIKKEKMPLYRSSKNRREWIHVLDHCRAIDMILKRGRIGETYNVGSGVEQDIEAISDLLLDIFGLDNSFKMYVEDRPGHDRRYLLDSSKIQKELGWTPEIPFENGFRETVEWYRENPDWWEPLLKRLTIDEAIWRN
jgi:dTDP-glucose 4,6-dehydratase